MSAMSVVSEMGAMRVVSEMSDVGVVSVMAVGQNVPEGGEVVNPTARSSKSCVAWGTSVSPPP